MKCDVDKPRRNLLAGVDLIALDAFSESGGFVAWGGEALAVVYPRGTCRNHMAFDRRVCAAGLTRFVRPVLPDDQPEGGPPDARFRTGWVLVTQAARGIRLRQEVECRWPDPEAN